MKIKSYVYITAVALCLFLVVMVGQWLPVKTNNNSLKLNHYYQVCSRESRCLLERGDIRVSFQVSPDSLPVLEALQLDVALEGVSARQVSVEFVGRDMAMGLLPVVLQKKGGWWSKNYTGVGRISFCTSDRNMVWVAKVLITTATDLHTVNFELQ